MTTAAASQRVQAKAARYLLEGHVRVDYADQRAFTGLVTGTRTTPYLVMCVDRTWRCDCPAKGTCAHEVACQAVWRPAVVAVPVPVAFEGDPFDLIPGC